MARNAPQKTAPRDETPGAARKTTNPHDPDATHEGEAFDESEDHVGTRGIVLGGAPGTVAEATKTISPSPEQIIERAKEANEAASPFASSRAGAEPRRFRVAHAQHVLYDNARLELKAGKVYAEHECDLDKLRAQGVVLHQISGPPVEDAKE
jgi:hypothetical protein